MSKKELKSKYQSMTHYLKTNPDAVAEESRGDQRIAFLHSFLALQMRAKAGEAVIQNKHSIAKVIEKR